MNIDFSTVITKFDGILARGLCAGIGSPDSQMCIEAAITVAMDLPFNDEPECVVSAVRRYKIALNDKAWSSPETRAKGLRDIGIAQIGSKGIVNNIEFAKRLAEKTIRVLLPAMLRECFPTKQWALAAANRCEAEGTEESARAAQTAAYAAAYAADAAAAYAAYAADAAAAAAYAADAAAACAAYASAGAYAADAAAACAAYASAGAKRTNKYLLLSASLALEVLRELGSPGCAWVGPAKETL